MSRSAQASNRDSSPRGTLRVDVLLDRLCLIKTRSQAGKACAEGRVFVNGERARASKDVRVGDRVRYSDRLSRYEEEILILEVPERPVAKAVARSCYERVTRREINGLAPEAPSRPSNAGREDDDYDAVDDNGDEAGTTP